MSNNVKSKSYYVFVGCMTLAVMIMGATFAYFSANATDSNTIAGNTESVTFGLSVSKVTDVDNAFGLIPMYDDRAPFAAYYVCKDDFGNPVCQIYRIVVKSNSPTVMFLDGYITMDTKEGVDVSFTRVYPLYDDVTDDDGNTTKKLVRFKTLETYNPNILDKEERLEYIRTSLNNDIDISFVSNGIRESATDSTLNYVDDSNCLLLANEMLGGSSDDMEKIFYAMVWVHDTGEEQNDIQGMQLAYRGTVTFITAEGNEISATFD